MANDVDALRAVERAASWATDLASHGVMVVALDHPYDAAATVLADGTVARSEVVATGDDDQDNRNAVAWTEIRAHDLTAVIDALTVAQPDMPLLTGVDLSHITVAGHSLGGAAALLHSRTDQRVDGVVDIDGLPRSDVSPRTIPTMLLVAGDADPNPTYQHVTDTFVAAGATRITVPGVAHLGFTDASLIVAPLPGVTGSRATAGPRAAATATLDAVRQSTPLDTTRLAPLGDLG